VALKRAFVASARPSPRGKNLNVLPIFNLRNTMAHPIATRTQRGAAPMSDSIQIRPVTRDDFDAWLPLWDAYNAFYGRSGETALPREITDITWGRFFDGYEPMHAMVAERNGQLLGIVHFLYHRHTTMAGPICYLQDLYTLDTERGKGVGRALIEAVYARAKADGSQRVYWQTHETNQTAMKLYDGVADKSGFVVYRKAL
jgi:GNAT superfamily N-acetyltransferase